MEGGDEIVSTAIAVGVAAAWNEVEDAQRQSLRGALRHLERAVQAFEHAARWYVAEDEGGYNQAVLTVHQLSLALRHCERVGLGIDELRERIAPVRSIYGRSAFVHRLQTWPRGYPGDFETIDYLLDGVNRTPRLEFAHHLEQYALWCAAAQQHRNKVAVQAALCRQAMASRPDTRILSIACGGSRDLASLVDQASSFRGIIAINDADRDALALSRQRLAPFGDRCAVLAGHALEIRTHAQAVGPFDLVLAGGLFDYLPDAVAIRLVRMIYREVLAAGGTFFFTNIASRNPYRPWMGIVGNWTLLERSEADLLRLVARAGVPDRDVDLTRDTTGLAWLVNVAKR
jgi:SAM-dependent methyltransferase